jgi:hypothetical protein
VTHRHEIAARLRREAADLCTRAAALASLADELDGSLADAAPSVYVTLREVATTLGITYDAARMRVARAGVGKQLANATYVPRAWLDEQITLVRSVRSVSEQPPLVR